MDFRLSHDGTISPLESNGLIKSKETVISLDYGTYTPVSPYKEANGHMKGNGAAAGEMVAPAATDDAEEDEESMDWWTKYFASIDTMIEIMPIVHVSQPWGASCSSISDDLALLTPIHPEALASASKSLLDVSNLGKMSALSVSSPALAADLGGGFLWKRLAKSGKTKQATSKTRLLES